MTAGLANQGVTISLTMLLQYLDCLTCCHNISDHTVIISMDIMTVRFEILWPSEILWPTPILPPYKKTTIRQRDILPPYKKATIHHCDISPPR